MLGEVLCGIKDVYDPIRESEPLAKREMELVNELMKLLRCADNPPFHPSAALSPRTDSLILFLLH